MSTPGGSHTASRCNLVNNSSISSKSDLMRLLLEQSSKIEKLEGRIQKRDKQAHQHFLSFNKGSALDSHRQEYFPQNLKQKIPEKAPSNISISRKGRNGQVGVKCAYMKDSGLINITNEDPDLEHKSERHGTELR